MKTSRLLRRVWQLFELDVDDLEQGFVVERTEDHNVVEAVEEFWLEVLFDGRLQSSL